MVEIKFKKEPHEQQQKFIDSDAPEQLYGGAKRGGKSVALCQKSSLLGFLFPGNRGLMCRYNFTDLQDTTLLEFFETVPSELILNHNKTDRQILLRTYDERSKTKETGTKDGFSRYASRQLYRGLGDPEDFEKTKGINLGHLEIDEPSEVPYEQYLMLRAQLTWQLPNGGRPPYMCLLASNPEPGWVEERFIENPKPGCVFIPSLPADNPFLPSDYVQMLIDTYPIEWVKKYVKGIWGASEGAVFKEFSEELHNLDNWLDTESDDETVRYSMQLNIIGGFDCADTGVVCYIQGGVNSAGDIFFFDEYYNQNRLIQDHAIDILAVKHRYEHGTYNYPCKPPRVQRQIIADPSIFNRTKQSTNEFQSMAYLYGEHGIRTIPGWNAMEMSIERIKEHLHPIDNHKHPFTGQFGSPSIFISKRRCPSLWREMRSWKRKRIANQSAHKPGYQMYVGTDHAIDPVRYIINGRPRRAQLVETDLKGMNEQDKFSARSHAKWAAKWGKQASPGAQGVAAILGRTR